MAVAAAAKKKLNEKKKKKVHYTYCYTRIKRFIGRCSSPPDLVTIASGSYNASSISPPPLDHVGIIRVRTTFTTTFGCILCVYRNRGISSCSDSVVVCTWRVVNNIMYLFFLLFFFFSLLLLLIVVVRLPRATGRGN